MSINLANVNISLSQFQEISSGTYNAGEVKLASETSLAKMNNRVTKREKNNEVSSHAEVLAIKEALVKALSGNGVSAEETNRIRRDLGLAPDGLKDCALRTRSLKPLSRQQIREILDRNANAINSFNVGNNGAVRIRTSAEIYGAEGMSQEAREKRDAVNVALGAPKEQVFVAMHTASHAVLATVNAMLAGKDDVGPDDRDGPISIMMKMVVASRPGLQPLLEEFYARPDVRQTIATRRTGDLKNDAKDSIAFESCVKDARLNRGIVRELCVQEHVFAQASRLAAFEAAGGARLAAEAGYRPGGQRKQSTSPTGRSCSSAGSESSSWKGYATAMESADGLAAARNLS